MSPRIRAVSRALVLVLAGLLLAGTAAAVAAPAGALAPVASSHPYSDPVYWPLRVPVNMDCFQRNPGCTTPHKYWMMDVVPNGQNKGTSRAGVYAMGAGIAHIGDAHGARCGKENSYGTWLWIDHGAGTLSRYGHLSRITVKPGQRVAAGQQIGVVGTTGKKANCHIAYTNFSVQRNGLATKHGVEFKTLVACSATTGRAQAWPKAISRYSHWEAVRHGTTFPAASGSCVSRKTPATANRPARPRIRAGHGKLRISWARPAAGVKADKVMVEISEFHTSRKYWDLPRNGYWAQVPASRSSVLVRHLTTKRLHRVRIYVHNRYGWSAATSWVQRKTK